MLQIVQGMYFRPVPLTDTLHRGILYTNLRAFGDRQAHSLMFGRLLPSTFHGVGSLTIEAREQLETVTESGGQDALVATSGHQLIDEIAAVIAFCMNVVCVRDHDMARSLISQQDGAAHQIRGPASILRQTFDAMVVLREEGLADLDAFLRALTALQRKSYEAAMRAIRQIVDATLMVDEDASLAYTLIVAALESLGQTTEPKPSTWLEYDQQKRERIDAAIKGLNEKRREQIQAAILANEHRALQRRFVAFVLGHVEPSFYRSEAIGAVRPIGATDLPAALRQAYEIRSRNVHALENLAPELVWAAANRADTVFAEDKTLLSLEGLSRLARHVVRRFVERGPKGVDPKFNYRSALPGIVRGRWAPQYWIHQAAGFDRKSAPAFFDGMIEFLIEGMSNRSEAGLVDMTAVLEKIENTALSLSKQSDRLAMAGIMALWNACAPAENRRRLKPKLKAKFEDDLAAPSIVSFAVKMVLRSELPWPCEALQTLAAERRSARLDLTSWPVPKRIDAALHIVVADQLLARGEKDGGLSELAYAVETVPGLVDLIKFEEAIKLGEDPALDLWRFLLGEQEFVTWGALGDHASPPVSGDDIPGASPPKALE